MRSRQQELEGEMKDCKRTAIVVMVLLAALTLAVVQHVRADAPPHETIRPHRIAQAATPAPSSSYPVTGSVVLKSGASVTGGTVGSVLAIDAAFRASSPSGQVTEMRTAARYGGNCLKDLSSVAWEPFAPAKTFTVTAALNFIGFYVSAQFRDANGNLSPIVCDDISVEGMPSRPTTVAQSATSATPALAVAPTAAPTTAPRAKASGPCGSGAIAMLVVGLTFILRRR
jgi:hypothetical protein